MNKYINPSLSKKWAILAIVIGTIALAGLAWGGVWVFGSLSFASSNYAQETAKPLEDALVKAGGINKCSSGDKGRGSDNTKPRYNAVYELPLKREQAIATINKIASDNGYILSHASLTNRGPVPVADPYIDDWFYDTAGKQSPYKDLEPGKINLFFVVNNDGPTQLSSVSCNTDKPVTINSSADISAVSIRIDLPAFKR